MCMPETSDTQHQVTAVEMWAMQEATPEGPMSPIEACSCDLHVLDPVQNSMKVACMTADDWQWTQPAEPIMGQVILRMQDRTLSQCKYKLADPLKLQQLLWECINLKLKWGIQYRKVLPRESHEALFQLELSATYWETTLGGCHNEINHLGLKRMPDLMHSYFFWPQMVGWVKKHVKFVWIG